MIAITAFQIEPSNGMIALGATLLFNLVVSIVGFAYMVGEMRESNRNTKERMNKFDGRLESVEALSNENTAEISGIQGALGLTTTKAKGHHA
jgi:hypothetical protein